MAPVVVFFHVRIRATLGNRARDPRRVPVGGVRPAPPANDAIAVVRLTAMTVVVVAVVTRGGGNSSSDRSRSRALRRVGPRDHAAPVNPRAQQQQRPWVERPETVEASLLGFAAFSSWVIGTANAAAKGSLRAWETERTHATASTAVAVAAAAAPSAVAVGAIAGRAATAAVAMVRAVTS